MANGFSTDSDDGFISGINVTPLVDVILVLLIIFMITAPVIYQSAIQVELPKATTGAAIKQANPLTFTLTKEGTLSWSKETISWEILSERLEKLKEENFSETAMINADEATPHGTVIKLIDALRKAGLGKFALNVSAEHHTP